MCFRPSRSDEPANSSHGSPPRYPCDAPWLCWARLRPWRRPPRARKPPPRAPSRRNASRPPAHGEEDPGSGRGQGRLLLLLLRVDGMLLLLLLVGEGLSRDAHAADE